MSEFICKHGHIIVQETENGLAEWLSNCETAVGIIVACITGVCAIIGIKYFGKLRERTTIATFTYWTQLNLRISRILNRLKNNNALVDNMFSKESRSAWPRAYVATSDELKEFYELITETVRFLNDADDQMPAYRGWTEDFYFIANFFDDVIRCDIRNDEMYFRSNEKVSIDARAKYCQKICAAMQRLVDEIQNKQKDAERKLSKKTKSKQ